MSVAALVLFYLVASANTQTCLTSSEEFAAEVVVPEYNNQHAQVLGERLGNARRVDSQYNPEELLTLLSESTVPSGLSIRLQRPTQVREREKPYLKFTSYSLPGVVRTNLEPLYYGWTIDCTKQECTFEKDLVRVTASADHPERGVTFEIEQNLPSCTDQCPGICVTFAAESRCFNARLKSDVDTLLRHVNLSTTFQEAFNSYRLGGVEGIALQDVVPLTAKTLDWHEAMREELVYLDTQGVIDVTRNDIESITTLAKEGQAGKNYRIVYDKTTKQWMYYEKTEGAVLSSERDCNAYNRAASSANSEQQVPFTPYYLIPLIVGVGGILILIVLIVVARLLRRVTRKHRTAHPPQTHQK